MLRLSPLRGVELCIAIAFLMLLGMTTLMADLANPLEFSRQAIAKGEWWRLWSAHFVHFGWYHTVFNTLGLFVFGYVLLYGKSSYYWLVVLGVSPVLISMLMLQYNPETEIYRGFSGVFYTLLMLGCYANWRENKRLSIALTILVLGKITVEQWPGYDIDYLKDEIGVAVMVDAHLYGALIGLAAVVFCHGYNAVKGVVKRNV